MRGVNAAGVGMASMRSDPMTAQAVAGNVNSQKVEDDHIYVIVSITHVQVSL